MINRRSNLLVLASILLSGNSGLAFTLTHSTSASTTSMMMMMTTSSNNNRRNFLNDFSSKISCAITLIGTTASSPQSAYALDFDAFERGEIATDTAKCDPKKDPKCIPKLSSDEALCQYGGGGNARGEACMRVRKAGGKLPEIKKEKSLGGAYAM